MLPIFIILSGGTLFVGLFSLLYLLFRPKLQLQRRLSGETSTRYSGLFARGDSLRQAARFLKPIGQAIPRSEEDATAQQNRLAAAGFRRKDALLIFVGLQVLLGGIVLSVFLSTGLIGDNPFLYFVLAVFLGAALPDLVLRQLIQVRKARIERGLPDALDLLVICVEGGMGLDQGILRVSRELGRAHKELADELEFYQAEVQAGRSREEALRNLGKRSPVDDLKSLAAVLIQTDRFGTDIADSLRVFSDAIRVKRRQRAEEIAAKMGVKMIPPMVFFIFPAIIIVILGPAVIRIVRHLLPTFTGQ